MKKAHILIGDVAARGGIGPEAVRFYERRGLLPRPHRAPNGYRIYSEEHLARIDFIKRAQSLGLSLDEIRDVIELRGHADNACQHVEELLEAKVQKVDEQIANLQRYRKDLMRSLRSCKKSLEYHPDDAVCPVIEQWDSRTRKE